MSDAPKIVSKVPEVTPELIAANDDLQKEWSKLYTSDHLTGEQYATRIIKDNLATIDALTRHFERVPEDEKESVKVRINKMRQDTATWAMSIGDFRFAAQVTPIDSEREFYESFVAAEEKDDDEWCEHPFFEHVDGEASQIAYREKDYFSLTHGQPVSVIRCRICGHRNARELPEEMRKLSEHRADAVRTGNDRKTTVKEIVS